MGTRLRVTGKVDTYYGAPQLDVDSQPTVSGQGPASPLLLRRVPVEADEWSLIRVTVRIGTVSKSGDAWRAEVTLSSGASMPVVGLAGSGIASTALIEGRDATLTGIVKRAYPTASDQRFALVPRSTADIVLGAVPQPSPVPVATSGGSAASVRPPASSSQVRGSDPPLPDQSAAASSDAVAGNGAAVSTTIDGLPSLVGQRVRVGGRITTVDGAIASLSDGTGQTSLRFMSAADAATVALAPDDLVNVIGWDAERDIGGTEVVVTAAADVSRPPVLGTGANADPSSDATHAASPDPIATVDQGLDAGSDGTPEETPGVGVVATGLAAALAAAGLMLLAGAATYLRRRRSPYIGVAANPAAAATAANPAAGAHAATAANPAAESPAPDGNAASTPENPVQAGPRGTDPA